MPLDKAKLQSALAELARHPGASTADCSGQWATAIADYMIDVQPSATAAVRAAQEPLRAALQAAFALSTAQAVATAMDGALMEYAVAVALGMATSGFTGAAPPSPLGFAALFEPPFAATHELAAGRFADAIDDWARTGSATSAAGSTQGWL